MAPEVTGLPGLPENLQRPDASIDRSRQCSQVKNLIHDVNDPASCLLCGGLGFIPISLDVDEEERRRLRVEDLPWDHPARTRESYIVGWDRS